MLIPTLKAKKDPRVALRLPEDDGGGGEIGCECAFAR
jgi:hypothetical protein